MLKIFRTDSFLFRFVSGSFERKLIEFPAAYNWYIKNEDFHQVKQVSVTFENGTTEIVYHPKFQKNVTRYILRPQPDTSDEEFNTNMTVAESLLNMTL